MEIINLTPHELTVFDESGTVKITIPASGTVARVATESRPTGRDLPLGSINAPIVRNYTGETTNLPFPNQNPHNIYIVSLFVLSACRGRKDIIAPDTGATCVRDDKGRILGVRQFIMPEDD